MIPCLGSAASLLYVCHHTTILQQHPSYNQLNPQLKNEDRKPVVVCRVALACTSACFAPRVSAAASAAATAPPLVLGLLINRVASGVAVVPAIPSTRIPPPNTLEWCALGSAAACAGTVCVELVAAWCRTSISGAYCCSSLRFTRSRDLTSFSSSRVAAPLPVPLRAGAQHYVSICTLVPVKPVN